MRELINTLTLIEAWRIVYNRISTRDIISSSGPITYCGVAGLHHQPVTNLTQML